MAVKIGQASIDERGKASGGAAGSQNGKELNIRNYYKSGWQCVLRCIDNSKAMQMAEQCRNACLNPNIGYDQGQRNTLRTQAKAYGYNLSAIKTPCECDCSSLISVVAECCGINVYSSTNAPTTYNMITAFLKTGLFVALTDSKYLNADTYLRAGDVLVKPGHTVMVLENGSGAGTTVAVNQNGGTYVVGKVYTTQVDLYVRDNPNGTKLKYDALTQNAKSNAKYDDYGCGILKAGTRVTCKAVSQLENSVWIQIPSGWICAKNNSKVYVK